MTAQLEKEKPELFIFNVDFWGSRADNPTLLRWFKERYEKIPGDAVQEHYLLMMLEDGELAKRLKGKKG